MARSTIMITTASMGAGKTYMRGAVYVAQEWLPYHKGLHVSNMPLKPDAMAKYCQRRYKRDCNAQERIIRMPAEMIQRWLDEKAVHGPWEEFGPGKRWSLSGTHVAIDEAHLFVPRAQFVERRRAWRDWIREIRHEGGTVEFLTQNLEALDNDLVKMCDIRYTISNRVSDRDPIFKIPMADWYELKGKISGEWSPVIQEHERRKNPERGWDLVNQRMQMLCQTYYDLYDSFSRPIRAEGQEGDEEEEEHKDVHEFERRGWVSLLLWFCRRNWWPMAVTSTIISVVLWVLLFGGIQFFLDIFMGYSQKITGHGGTKAVVQEDGSITSVPTGDEGVKERESARSESGPVDVLSESVTLDMVLFEFPQPSGEVYRYTVGDYLDVLDDRDWLATTVEVQKEELEKLRDVNNGVVMLTGKYVVFESGEMVRPGADIKRSGHNGKRLVSINFEKREVLLSDGTVLSAGVRSVESRGNKTGILPGGIRSVSGTGSGGSADEGGGPTRIDGGGRGNGRSVYASSGDGDGGVGDMGGGIRSGGGESGGSRSNGTGNARVSSAALGG